MADQESLPPPIPPPGRIQSRRKRAPDEDGTTKPAPSVDSGGSITSMLDEQSEEEDSGPVQTKTWSRNRRKQVKLKADRMGVEYPPSSEYGKLAHSDYNTWCCKDESRINMP